MNNVVVVSIIYGIFIISLAYMLYVFMYGKKSSILSDVKKFYGSSFSSLSVGLIIAFLVSSAVNSFTSHIMTPLVKSIFPSENIWDNAVDLPRDNKMYPGLFFQSVVSFIMSLMVLFIIVYSISRISNISIIGKNKEIIVYGFVFVIIVGLMIWNLAELVRPSIENVKNKTV